MFKLVVLSVVVAAAAASPSVLGLGPLGLGGVGALGLGGLGIGPWGTAGLGLTGPLGLGGIGLAGPLGLGGIGLAGPLAAGHIAPAPAPIAAAPLGLAYNYRGPVSLAPGQPANIIAADGRPLDTLSVNIDRAAHLTHRAVDAANGHLLKKRSLVGPLVAPAATSWSHTSRIDIPARLVPGVGGILAAGPLAHSGILAAGPLAHGGILATGPLAHGGIGAHGLGPWGRVW